MIAIWAPRVCPNHFTLFSYMEITHTNASTALRAAGKKHGSK
jgi:hypothetical protein